MAEAGNLNTLLWTNEMPFIYRLCIYRFYFTEESESEDSVGSKVVDFTHLEKRLQYSLHKE